MISNYNYSTYRRTNNRSVDIIVAAPEASRPYSYYSYRSNWLQLYDSLALTKTLFPDMLQFLNIDDFKMKRLS